MGFIIEENRLKKYEGNEEVVVVPDLSVLHLKCPLC